MFARRAARWDCGFCVALLTLSACTLDSRDLAAFRLSASGPEKLCAVLGASERAAPLRAEAALALLDLTRADVDGRVLLFSELTRLDAQGKRAILPSFKAGLSERMQTDEGSEPSSDALRAKDAGTKLLPLLDPSERNMLGAELLAFVAADVTRRADRGELTLEQIANRIGPASAHALTDALSEKHDADNLARLSASSISMPRVTSAHAQASAWSSWSFRIVPMPRAQRRWGDSACSPRSAASLTRARCAHACSASRPAMASHRTSGRRRSSF